MISSAIEKVSSVKVVFSSKNGRSWETLVGYTAEQLKQHLEKQFTSEMNWKNHGELWEIDHIKPCAVFDLTDVNQQKECFNYINTQPLYKTDNRSKGDKF